MSHQTFQYGGFTSAGDGNLGGIGLCECLNFGIRKCNTFETAKSIAIRAEFLDGSRFQNGCGTYCTTSSIAARVCCCPSLLLKAGTLSEKSEPCNQFEIGSACICNGLDRLEIAIETTHQTNRLHLSSGF